ncbi:MAG: Flp family type IVb pilin [Erythrobacter sp.]|nr:MAG: Flp family type IVb pilin [Erythrobacter sp.]
MFTQKAMRLATDDRGATAMEYGLLAMLIGVALAGIMFSLGEGVETQYDTVNTEYAEAANGHTPE